MRQTFAKQTVYRFLMAYYLVVAALKSLARVGITMLKHIGSWQRDFKRKMGIQN